MKNLKFAIEQYVWNDILECQIWRVKKVFDNKADAINFIIDNANKNKPMMKISEVYNNIDY